jgi:hypothetical protein
MIQTKRTSAAGRLIIGYTLAISFASALMGCSGGGFGESVAVPQEMRVAISGGLSPGERIAFPDDKPFIIAESARESTGQGVATAQATEEGSANCQIKATGSDKASGEFELGHVIYNDTDKPLDVSVLFDFEYAFEILDAGPEGMAPETVGLKVYVKDSDQVVLHRRTILEQGDGLTAWKGAGRESPWFNLTLQPRLAYNLVLAGRLATTAEEDGKPVEAKMSVSGLRIEINARSRRATDVK